MVAFKFVRVSSILDPKSVQFENSDLRYSSLVHIEIWRPHHPQPKLHIKRLYIVQNRPSRSRIKYFQR